MHGEKIHPGTVKTFFTLDIGSLLVQETVIRLRACFEKHPGLFRTRDKLFYKPIITVSKRLERWVFEHGCLGAALQVKGLRQRRRRRRGCRQHLLPRAHAEE